LFRFKGLAWVIIVLCLTGCSSDPKGSFEEIASTFKGTHEHNCEGCQEELGRYNREQMLRKMNDGTEVHILVAGAKIAGVEYNVVKTDSLVSPYTGTIVLTLEGRCLGCDSPTVRAKEYRDYAFQDNKWVIKSCRQEVP